MLIQKLRLKRGWSQHQLAEFSGLSVRTIQRIEAGQQPSMETLKSIAAVFDVDHSSLLTEQDMTTPLPQSATEEAEAFHHVRHVKRFYMHLIRYVIVISLLTVLNLATSPHQLWVLWVALGWGIGVLAHGVGVFYADVLFSPAWEKRQVEKRLGRSL